MTGSAGVPGQTPESLESAAAGLGHLRELLKAAGHGQAGVEEVGDSMRNYLAAHGPALRAAATNITEEARRQALTELYKWRDHLDAQLNAGKPARPSSAEEAEKNAATDRGADREPGPW